MAQDSIHKKLRAVHLAHLLALVDKADLGLVNM